MKEDYSAHAVPLTLLLKKDTKFTWTQECEQAFVYLKNIISKDLGLPFPQFGETFFIHTDVSNYAIGAVLSQEVEGDLKPLTFASKKLNSAQVNYSTIEKELYAIVWAIKEFRLDILGQKFVIKTDHQPLVWAFNLKDPSSRLMRWRLKLAEHDCLIEYTYIKGKDNTVADAMSRIQVVTRRQLQNQQKLRQKINTRPFEHRHVSTTNTIIVLSSLDKIVENKFFKGLSFTISKKGDIERIKLGKKIIYLVFYRKIKRKYFLLQSFVIY